MSKIQSKVFLWEPDTQMACGLRSVPPFPLASPFTVLLCAQVRGAAVRGTPLPTNIRGAGGTGKACYFCFGYIVP